MARNGTVTSSQLSAPPESASAMPRSAQSSTTKVCASSAGRLRATRMEYDADEGAGQGRRRRGAVPQRQRERREEQEEEGPVACSQECRVAASARGTAHSKAVRVMRGVKGARCMP